MSDITIQKFCALCGRTNFFKNRVRGFKKLYIKENGEDSDLGYMCEACYKFLEEGKVFAIPRNNKRKKTPS